MAIRVNHMLARMEQGAENGNSPEFSLEFITSDGRVRRIARALRGAKSYTHGDGGEKSKASPHQKERNLINVTDMATDEVRAVMIACITRFNGELVHH